MRDLVGRTAIVTGASRGLGSYIARALAQEQMNLVLVARSANSLTALADELRSAGAQAIALPADVLDSAAMQSLVKTTYERFAAIDVLVNNAGIELFMEYHQLDADELERLMRVNLLAPLQLTHLVLRGMLRCGRGHIVNISSLAGKGMPGYAEPYVAAKAGLIGFTASLRASYRGRGVSASVIAPGFVSQVGMYHTDSREAGPFSPWILGTTTPQAVAGAVVGAIKHDRAEVIVNPMPTRLFLALRELAPGLGEWLAQRLGVSTVFQRLAQVRDRRSSSSQ